MKARLPGRSPVVKHNFVCICVHSRDPRISKNKFNCGAPDASRVLALVRFPERLNVNSEFRPILTSHLARMDAQNPFVPFVKENIEKLGAIPLKRTTIDRALLGQLSRRMRWRGLHE